MAIDITVDRYWTSATQKNCCFSWLYAKHSDENISQYQAHERHKITITSRAISSTGETRSYHYGTCNIKHRRDKILPLRHVLTSRTPDSKHGWETQKPALLGLVFASANTSSGGVKRKTGIFAEDTSRCLEHLSHVREMERQRSELNE